jgi:hypothetical protein
MADNMVMRLKAAQFKYPLPAQDHRRQPYRAVAAFRCGVCLLAIAFCKAVSRRTFRPNLNKHLTAFEFPLNSQALAHRSTANPAMHRLGVTSEVRGDHFTHLHSIPILSMKTSLSFTLLVAACGMLSAQPVLNTCDNSFVVGDFFDGFQHSVDTSAFSSIQTGANVTWDYSGLITLNTASYQSTLVEVINAPVAFHYANATIAEKQINFLHSYSGYLASDVTYHGFYFDNSSCEWYMDPIVQYTCPLNLGGTFYDTYSGETCTFVQFTGSRTGTYVGYGTLILPQQVTIPNAILIHTTDTLVKQGTNTYYDYYTWYDGANNRAWLTAARVGNDFTPSTFSASYLQISLSILSAAQQALADAIQVHPNPATTEVQVDVPAQLGRGQFHLLDLHGKMLLQSPIHAGQGEVMLPELPAGIYLYHVRDQRGNLAKAGKLVKE